MGYTYRPEYAFRRVEGEVIQDTLDFANHKPSDRVDPKIYTRFGGAENFEKNRKWLVERLTELTPAATKARPARLTKFRRDWSSQIRELLQGTKVSSIIYLDAEGQLEEDFETHTTGKRVPYGYALALLMDQDRGWWWVLKRCPQCGKFHLSMPKPKVKNKRTGGPLEEYCGDECRRRRNSERQGIHRMYKQKQSPSAKQKKAGN